MDREDIIRMAREAHVEALSQGKGMHIWHGDAFINDVQDFCVRFAALVRADEREACAKIAKDWVGLNHFDRTLLRTTHAPLKPIYHDKDNSVCSEVVSDWDVFFDAIEAKLKEKNT